MKYKTLYILICLLMACTNPFAPKKVNSPTSNILGDQRTIDGLFQNFKYAYTFKDTLIYRNILDEGFTFVFRDYDKQIDQTWDKEMDLITTSRLFQSTQNLDLIWNDSYVSFGDSLLQDIYRGFYLNIVFSASDQININGKVNFRIVRKSTLDPWKIKEWRDESNY